jgi:hypothetical protein
MGTHPIVEIRFKPAEDLPHVAVRLRTMSFGAWTHGAGVRVMEEGAQPQSLRDLAEMRTNSLKSRRFREN